MKFAVFILINISLLIVSCTSRNTKLERGNLIPEKELIELLTDIHISDGLLTIPGINAEYSILDSITTYYHVIEKHGYTKEIMDQTMKYYFIKNPEKLNKIYDVVLGKLSEMESHAEKGSLIEQARLSNLWKEKDFYALPSENNNDSTEIDFTFSARGIYLLSFTTTVYPDDQSVNPRFTIYSVPPDSIKTGKKTYFKTVEYLKDGKPHSYSVPMIVDKTTLHFGGSLFDSNNMHEGIENHYIIENISITFSFLE